MGLEHGSLEAYLVDARLAFDMSAADRARQSARQQTAPGWQTLGPADLGDD